MGHRDLLVTRTYLRQTPNARVCPREASAGRLSSRSIIVSIRLSERLKVALNSKGRGLRKTRDLINPAFLSEEVGGGKHRTKPDAAHTIRHDSAPRGKCPNRAMAPGPPAFSFRAELPIIRSYVYLAEMRQTAASYPRTPRCRSILRAGCLLPHRF